MDREAKALLRQGFASSGLHRRDIDQHQADQALRLVAEGRAVQDACSFRQMAYADLHRRPALPRHGRTVDHRCADERPALRDLDRNAAGTRASARRRRHPRQCRLPQERARRRTGAQARRLVALPAAILTRPEPDRDGVFETQGVAAQEGCANLRRPMPCNRRYL